MTIGDCWGIENYMPEMDDDKGTSLFMVHSPKGERILEAIREDLAVKEAELNRFLSGDADLRKSVDMHPNRKKYWAGVYRGESLDVLHGYVRKSFLQKVVGLIRCNLGFRVMFGFMFVKFRIRVDIYAGIRLRSFSCSFWSVTEYSDAGPE